MAAVGALWAVVAGLGGGIAAGAHPKHPKGPKQEKPGWQSEVVSVDGCETSWTT